MLEIQEDSIIGMDVKGNSIYLQDFRKNFGVLRRCKKLTPEGRALVKRTKFYRNNERRFNEEDIKKIQGVY